MNKPTKVQATGQSGTTTGSKAGNRATKRLWIGVDLGDRYSEVCILNSRGEVQERDRIRMTPAAVREYFSAFAGAQVAIETGTHSPWMSRELTACGLTVTVANAREVRKIHQSDRKNEKVNRYSGGMAGALGGLRQQPYGEALLAVMAIGLLC